jgi:hypothetical protein
MRADRVRVPQGSALFTNGLACGLVTATRDRRSDLDDRPVETTWEDRPILGTSRGLPWWAAILLTVGLATVAAVVDLQRQGSLGRIYQGAYALGCVAAVCWVRRRNLFGPMVAPPLVFAVTAVGGIVLLAPDSAGTGGLKQLLFSVALPLTSNFPTMGITTGVVLGLGVIRLLRERDPTPRVRPGRSMRDGGPGNQPAERGRPVERRPRDLEPDRRAGQRSERVRGALDRDGGAGPGRRDRNTGRAGRAGRDARGEGLPPRTQRGTEQPDPPRRRQGAPRSGQRRDERSLPDRRDNPGAPEPPRRQARRRPPEDKYR